MAVDVMEAEPPVTTGFRTEEDLLGARRVPADAYWGIHTLRAMENFCISGTQISSFPELIQGMVMTKKAAAVANRELGVIPGRVADCIIQACNEFLTSDRYYDQFPVDVFQGGAGTSLNMNVNEVIANIALEKMGRNKGEYQFIHPNDHVNRCQSTNCTYPTGLRIALYQRSGALLSAVEELVQSLLVRGEEFKNCLKMGRTQLQDAVPMTLGQEFRAWGNTLLEELRTIRFSTALLLEVNLGGTAVGTGVNTVAGYRERAVAHLAEISGFDCVPAADLIEASSDCGAYVMVHSSLRRLALKLSKICNDLRLLSSGPRAGLNEINLPELQAGSSIMPAKVNPVIPEVVNQVCFKVAGNDTAIGFAAEAGQLQLNVMEPVIAQCLFESLNLLTNACRSLADKCIDGITINRQQCEQDVRNSIGLVTLLNPEIGHHAGDQIGRICKETGKSVAEVALELGLLSEARLKKLLSSASLLRQTSAAD